MHICKIITEGKILLSLILLRKYTEHNLENLYVDHLGLSFIYTKIENAGFS